MVQYDSGNTKSKWEIVQLLYVHQIWPRRACSRFLVKDQNLVSSTHTGWLTTTYTLVLGDLTPSLESMGPWTHMGYAGRPSRMHMCAHASAVSLSKSVLKKKNPRKVLPLRKMAPSAGCFLECLSIFLRIFQLFKRVALLMETGKAGFGKP